MATPPHPATAAAAVSAVAALGNSDHDDDQLIKVAAAAAMTMEETKSPIISRAFNDTAASLLPRYVIFKSMYNTKYLQYYDDEPQAKKFLQFSGPNTEMNPAAKFEIEAAKSARNLVHIRSSYNNKYWRTQGQGPTSNWVTASADEPEENQTLWSCTLFQPLFVDAAAKTIRLRHVKTGNHACLWRTAYPFDDCLLADYPYDDPEQCDVFTVIDWESIVILPKRIMLKGDMNDYLKAYSDGSPHLAFSTTDVTEASVPNEIIPGPDGTVRIKNVYFNKLWRHSPEANNWILADSDDTTSNDTLFQPVKFGKNQIALRNVGNNMFCKRLTAGGLTSCLSAMTPTIDPFARMTVEEPVVKRIIDRVKYRLMDAKIYGEEIIDLRTEFLTNRTTQPNTLSTSLAHTDTRSSTWHSSLSLKLGFSQTVRAGVPLIGVGAEVKISAEISGGYNWGEAVTTSVEVASEYSATVPPMSRLKVTLLATQGSCDVPFSYVQRDTLVNGDVVITEMDGGVYTGINSFNFRYEAEELPL